MQASRFYEIYSEFVNNRYKKEEINGINFLLTIRERSFRIFIKRIIAILKATAQEPAVLFER